MYLPMLEIKEKALELRLACYCSANENACLAKLAAHTWRHLWFFSGHPNFRTGTLCGPHLFVCVLLVCQANLDANNVLKEVPDGCRPGFRVFNEIPDGCRPLSNTLAMECILRGDSDRLGTLDVALLEEEVAISSEITVNPFQYAAALGRLDCFEVLIDELGATSPLLVDRDGKLSSGVRACCDARFPFGDREAILHLLLSHFPLQSLQPQLLLESASRFGALWMLSLLFSRLKEAEKDGNPVAVDLDVALFEACENGHTDCARLLLERGADANAEDKEYVPVLEGPWPLSRAVAQGHADCTRLLLEHGADANAVEGDGYTVLMEACGSASKRDPDCVRLLLEHGADVNAKSEDGWTALMRTCHCSNCLVCVRLLLEHGADVNAVDNDGNTALMRACRSPYRSNSSVCFLLLLEHGADVNAENEDGITALMRARQDNKADCVRVLLQHGAEEPEQG